MDAAEILAKNTEDKKLRTRKDGNHRREKRKAGKVACDKESNNGIKKNTNTEKREDYSDETRKLQR
jgi:hypothetical protein